MAKLSLYLHNDRLLMQKSNGPAGIIEVPYHMEDYSTLISECTKHIPTEWQQTIDSLYQQERQLIKYRQQLMAQYRKEILNIVQPVIINFKLDNPEYFI